MPIDLVRGGGSGFVHVSDVAVPDYLRNRITCDIPHIDAIFGGGLVKSGVILLAGAPGVGKTTFLLQLLSLLGECGYCGVYNSAEEAIEQLKATVERVKAKENFFLGNISQVEDLEKHCKEAGADIIIADSVQGFHCYEAKSPGSAAQMEASCDYLIRMAKDMGVCLFIISQLNKDGTLKGPNTLSHNVDVVSKMHHTLAPHIKIIDVSKNRFGALGEYPLFWTKYGRYDLHTVAELPKSHQINTPGEFAEFIKGAQRICVSKTGEEFTEPFVVSEDDYEKYGMDPKVFIRWMRAIKTHEHFEMVSKVPLTLKYPSEKLLEEEEQEGFFRKFLELKPLLKEVEKPKPPVDTGDPLNVEVIEVDIDAPEVEDLSKNTCLAVDYETYKARRDELRRQLAGMDLHDHKSRGPIAHNLKLLEDELKTAKLFIEEGIRPTKEKDLRDITCLDDFTRCVTAYWNLHTSPFGLTYRGYFYVKEQDASMYHLDPEVFKKWFRLLKNHFRFEWATKAPPVYKYPSQKFVTQTLEWADEAIKAFNSGRGIRLHFNGEPVMVKPYSPPVYTAGGGPWPEEIVDMDPDSENLVKDPVTGNPNIPRYQTYQGAIKLENFIQEKLNLHQAKIFRYRSLQ